jgi:hypothetical protein
MERGFPSETFFERLKERINRERGRFAELGLFDASFGVRIAADKSGQPERLIALRFETYQCTGIAEVAADKAHEDLDFILEAPAAVWRKMLVARAPGKRRDNDHSINTLSHFDFPMRVSYAEPDGHDRLYRFAESVQLVFDLAAAIEAEGGGHTLPG